MKDMFNTFSAALEKGRTEWNTFNAVAHDHTSLINANAYVRKPSIRIPTNIRFGASRLFVLKHS